MVGVVVTVDTHHNCTCTLVVGFAEHFLDGGGIALATLGSADARMGDHDAGKTLFYGVIEHLFQPSELLRAAGVGFGSGDMGQALVIAGGIALQNIPEGMVIIGPMLSSGVSKRKTFVCAMMTGLVEVVGTFIGYFAVSVSTAILPFALAFAGGTMLYVVSDEMIPETHAHGGERGATYALLVGFCVMLITDVLLH